MQDETQAFQCHRFSCLTALSVANQFSVYTFSQKECNCWEKYRISENGREILVQLICKEYVNECTLEGAYICVTAEITSIGSLSFTN